MARHDEPGWSGPVVPALFFLSGTAGLIYQVVWFRRFSHLWGNSTLAMAATIGTFLLGLCLGAFLFGRLARRARRPLLWYGFLELGIGILGAFTPLTIAWVNRTIPALASLLQDQPPALSAMRFVLTFMIIGPACLLMGGTLPLLSEHAVRNESGLRQSVALLYGVNTLGAAIGCYLAGFHLLPAIGLLWTSYVAALLNLTVALASIALAGRFPQGSPAAANPAVELRPAKTLLVAIALNGAGAIILEIVWARQLAVMLGGSTYAFSAMLAVVLVGIGLGSLLFRLLPDEPTRLHRIYGSAVVLLVVSVALGKWLIPYLTELVGSLSQMRSRASANALLCVAASMALELLPAMAMGLLFPLCVSGSGSRRSAGSETVGAVYGWNTTGAVLGAASGSILILPALGISGTVALAQALFLFGWMLLVPRRTAIRPGGLLLMAAGIAAIVGTIHEQDPRITNTGMYLYGRPRLPEAIAKARVLFFAEGASANVLVLENGTHRSLRLNGKVDASNSGDMAMQLGMAFVPRILRPEAEQVLVIGYGSGTTAGASLLFPTTQVVCCEIEPAVVAAGAHFSDVNHHPGDTPHLSMVFDDGRSYVQGTTRRFDLILSEPSNPWLAGVANLFTREFYEAARERLAPNGIFAQWIQTYSLTADDYTVVLRTLMTAFPHCMLARISDGDTIMLASAQPLALNAATMTSAQELVDRTPEARADLMKYFGTADVRSLVLESILLGEDQLRRLVVREGDDTINTDLNARLESDAPLHLWDEPQSPDEMPEIQILRAVDAGWISDLFDRTGSGDEQLDAIKQVASLLDRHRQRAAARDVVALGLRITPRDPYLLAERMILSSAAEFSRYKADIDDMIGRAEDQAARAGTGLWEQHRYVDAVSIFERIVAAFPGSAASWTNLGVNYSALGRREDAGKALAKAISIDPLNAFTQKAFQDYQAEADRVEAP